eukprot:TRINITY_DN73820_c0_g1_i1.p1 TRINITY_DN73820_c0_g1~~TRINITY_DN73820_c0_g1_i1.p1  ORF type:complete len:522 (-),score=108.36 TRINITY_DN73820_c0_g1_i1:101-1534(-)
MVNAPDEPVGPDEVKTTSSIFNPYAKPATIVNPYAKTTPEGSEDRQLECADASKPEVDVEDFWALAGRRKPPPTTTDATSFNLVHRATRKGKGGKKGGAAGGEDKASDDGKREAEGTVTKEPVVDKENGGQQKSEDQSKDDEKAAVDGAQPNLMTVDVESFWLAASATRRKGKGKGKGDAATDDAMGTPAETGDATPSLVAAAVEVVDGADVRPEEGVSRNEVSSDVVVGDGDGSSCLVTAANEGVSAAVEEPPAPPAKVEVPVVPLRTLSVGKLKTVARFYDVDIKGCLEKAEMLANLSKADITDEKAQQALETDANAPSGAAADSGTTGPMSSVDQLFAMSAPSPPPPSPVREEPEPPQEPARKVRRKTWKPAFGASIYSRDSDNPADGEPPIAAPTPKGTPKGYPTPGAPSPKGSAASGAPTPKGTPKCPPSTFGSGDDSNSSSGLSSGTPKYPSGVPKCAPKPGGPTSKARPF